MEKKCGNTLAKKVYRDLSHNLLLFYYHNKSCMVNKKTTGRLKLARIGSRSVREVGILGPFCIFTLQYNTIGFTFGLGPTIQFQIRTSTGKNK